MADLFSSAYGLSVRDAIYGYIEHLLAPRPLSTGWGDTSKADCTTQQLSEVLDRASEALGFLDKTGQLWEKLNSIMHQVYMGMHSYCSQSISQD